jgi:hypothetical protein
LKEVTSKAGKVRKARKLSYLVSAIQYFNVSYTSFTAFTQYRLVIAGQDCAKEIEIANSFHFKLF